LFKPVVHFPSDWSLVISWWVGFKLCKDEYDEAAEEVVGRRAEVRQEQGVDGSQRNYGDLQRQFPTEHSSADQERFDHSKAPSRSLARPHAQERLGAPQGSSFRPRQTQRYRQRPDARQGVVDEEDASFASSIEEVSRKQEDRSPSLPRALRQEQG